MFWRGHIICSPKPHQCSGTLISPTSLIPSLHAKHTPYQTETVTPPASLLCNKPRPAAARTPVGPTLLMNCSQTLSQACSTFQSNCLASVAHRSADACTSPACVRANSDSMRLKSASRCRLSRASSDCVQHTSQAGRSVTLHEAEVHMCTDWQLGCCGARAPDCLHQCRSA